MSKPLIADLTIHNVKEFRVASVNPANANSVAFEISDSGGDAHPVEITLFGSQSVMMKALAAFGDENTVIRSPLPAASKSAADEGSKE